MNFFLRLKDVENFTFRSGFRWRLAGFVAECRKGRVARQMAVGRLRADGCRAVTRCERLRIASPRVRANESFRSAAKLPRLACGERSFRAFADFCHTILGQILVRVR